MKCMALWVQYSRRNWLSKTAKCLGGKGANKGPFIFYEIVGAGGIEGGP